MESLKRALESIGRLWANLSATQRVVVGAAAAALALVLVWGSTASTEAWVRVAGPEIDAASRLNILRHFQEHNQKHEVRGSDIFVPKRDADRVMLELAGEGAISTEGFWKFLESANPLVDRHQKDLLAKRALEQQLSAMIRRAEFVRNANVVITLASPNETLLDGGSRAKASVQVELQPGKMLSPRNVLAIANLVARAVPGLDPDQVVICDNKLNSYAVPAVEGGAVADYAGGRERDKEIEDDLRAQVRQAMPPGARISVRVSTRRTWTEQEIHKVSNPKPILEVEHKVIEKGSSAAAPKALKGEPGEGPAPAPEAGGRTETDTRTESVTDREVTRTKDPPGKIEKISIAVLIPVEVGPDNKELAEEAKKLPAWRTHVETIAGLEGEKSISVQLIPMKRPEPLPASTEPTAVEWLWAHGPQAGLFVLAAAGLVLLALVVRGVMAKDTVEDLQALGAALSEEAAPELALPAEGDLGRLKQGLQEMVDKSPKAVAASLKSFMSGR